VANDYFDNSDASGRFMGGETARGSDVDAKLDAIQSGFEKLPTANQVNFGAANFGTEMGAANAYVVTLPKAPTSYFTGLQIKFIPTNSNTAASSVNVNELGVKTIVRQDGTALRAGDIPAGGRVTATYDGTNFVLDTSTGRMVTDAESAAQSASADRNAVSQMKTDVSGMKDTTTQLANQVAQNTQSVASNTQIVADDKAVVVQLKSDTESLASQVSQNAQTVNTKAGEVETARLEVSQNAQTVNTKAGEVESARQEVATNTNTVNQKASLVESDRERAEAAANTATEAAGIDPNDYYRKDELNPEMTGQVAYFAMTTPPNGWLKANGAELSRTIYAALFAVIGTTFGSGDGSTTFNLPDLRGQFLRAWDDGKGIDPERGFGSAQSDDNKAHSHEASSNTAGSHSHSGTAASSGAHTHTMTFEDPDGSYDGDNALNPQYTPYGTKTTMTTSSSGSHTHSISINTNGSHSHSITINQSGGNESRPKNIALLACIRY
jgi:microcystin-dependent protein